MDDGLLIDSAQMMMYLAVALAAVALYVIVL